MLRVHSLHALGDAACSPLRARLREDVALSVSEELVRPAEVDVLVAGRPTAAHLAALPALRAVVVPWAGVGASTLELLRAHPVVALHNLHHNAAPVAEHALALLLAAAKSVLPADARMRAHDWSDRGARHPAVLLAGRRAVVLGFGAIGRRLAPLLQALGMDVVGVRARAAARDERVDGVRVVGPEAWRTELVGAAALVVCVPATPETRGLVGAAELAALPQDAVLVNVARGEVVDERALHAALRDGRLHGAGLDVWWRYPREGEERTPPATLPFEELSNVVHSPHRAGSCDRTEELRADALAELLHALADGRPAPHAVALDRGY